jgi:serine/threonine protein kinase/CRP-like cAMP-binding protein
VCAAGKVDITLPEEDELMDIFKKVPDLRKLDEADLQKACKIAKCQRYDTDQAIVALGTRNDDLHIVIEGKAGIAVPHTIRTVGEGQYFGNEHLLPTISNAGQHFSAVHGPCTTISISSIDFDNLHITKNHVDKADEVRVARNFANVADLRTTRSIVDGVCQSTGFPVLEQHEQTIHDVEMIQAAVRNNNVMGDVIQLCEQQCKKIAECVYLVDVKRDQIVIQKGSKGSCLYIVHEGLLDVTIDETQVGEFKFRSGEAFGELGLLYDAPRAVTITAASDCRLWVLTRAKFQTVIRTVHSEQITEHAGLLRKIPYLLSQVQDNNIDLIADMVEEMLLLETEEVCVAGQDAGQLYVVFDGRCTVLDENREVIKTLNKGDWVGEEQIEKNIPHTHTVRVVSEAAVVLCLDVPSLRMASATASSLGSTVLFEEGDQEGQIEKTRQAHEMIDKSLKKALKSYSKHQDKADLPPLSQQKVIGGLGEGSFGLVYLTESETGKNRYALKVVSKDHILREGVGNMMKNERDIMMLLDSDFVVRLYRTYHCENYVYLLLEPVAGGELFDVYNERDLFCDLNASKFYICCVILALEHLHEKRVIYRDLKLENCLVDHLGYVKLTDMGIAKVVVGKTYTVCGTADYLAPETLRQLGHNRAVDWWACSVLLFIMCSGRSPFDAPDVQQIYKNIIKGYSKVKIPQTFPSDLIDLIKSLGRKKPEERLTMQKGGVENAKEMPYFTKFDWQALAERSMPSPFTPQDLDVEKVRKKQLSRKLDLTKNTIDEWDGTLVSSSQAAKDKESQRQKNE